MTIKRIIMPLLALLYIQECVSKTLGDNTFVSLQGYPFVYVSESETDLVSEVSDSLFNAVARGIRFEVNKTNVRPDDPFIKTYTTKLVPLLRERGLILKKVIVRGAASPEGPYENNCRLGNERTHRLVEFLGNQLDNSFTADDMNTQSITEDYGYLIYLMKAKKDVDAPVVSRIWTDCGHEEQECKKRLMEYRGGRMWKRLLKEYFPRLRQARVMMWFARKTSIKLQGMPLPVETVTMQPPSRQLQPAPLQPLAKEPRQRMVALRTNLLHDFLYMPNFGFAPGANIQVEYFPLDGHLTYNAGFTFTNHRHWSDYKFFQIRNLNLELRRYFRGGGQFTGPFLNAYAHGFSYGIGFNANKGWEGEGGGAGVGLGYTASLNRSGSLRIEFTLDLGFFITRYDPYVFGNPITGATDGKYYYDYTGKVSDFKKRDHQFTWFGPTDAGIHITYDILYYNKNKVRKHKMQKGGIRWHVCSER